MFKRVLIAEDEDLMDVALRGALKELDIMWAKHDYVFYSKDAIIRIKNGIKEESPYELLITDLSFTEDFPKQEISSGSELIKAVKKIQPNIKVLVFSVDDRKSTVDRLFTDLKINGYVPKNRGAAIRFRLAINTIYNGNVYYPLNLLK